MCDKNAENQYVRVQARLKEDAIATVDQEKYKVTLTLRIPRRLKDDKAECTFAFPGRRPEDVRELLSSLRKDQVVELVAKLEEGKLVSEFVRIERTDYRTENPSPVLL